MRLVPYIETPREIHEHREWVRREAMRYYVETRRRLASVHQVVDVVLLGPRCEDCQASDPSGYSTTPTISPSCWEEDIAIEIGEEKAQEIATAVAEGEDPAWQCVDCHTALSPWAGDTVYIVRRHLEEDHSLEADTGQKKKPSRVMRALVLELYENSCFGCGASGDVCALTIDHIVPRARGGNAAFRNLQPLCRACQERKADTPGEAIGVHAHHYFEPAPSDGYEGLFW